MKLKLLNNQSGSGIVMALISVTVLTFAGYYTLDYIDRMDVNRRNLDLNLKATLIAKDAIEATKYLMFYEKIFALNKPQVFPNSWAQYSDTATNMINWIESCGDLMSSVGDSRTTFKLDDETVFCPTDLRDFRVSGDIYEVQLDKMSQMGDSTNPSPVEKVKPGVYKVGPIKFTTKTAAEINPSEPNDVWLEFGLDKVTRERITSIETFIEIYTKETGFVSSDSERYIKIISQVKFGTPKTGVELSFAISESFIMRASMMKEFALFMAYPGNTNNLKPNLGIGNDSEFHGKVFFNGNYNFSTNFDFSDGDNSNIPIFHDLVIFTGDPVGALPAPTQANIAEMKKKFKKGFMFGFGEDFVFDSNNISNKTGGLYRRDQPYGMSQYLNKATTCTTFGGGRADVTIAASISNCSNADVGRWGGNMIPLKGGRINNVIVNRNTAFIMTGMETLNLAGTTSIYGTVMPGTVTSPGFNQKVDFYSLTNLTTGLPGIDNDAVLRRMVQQANSTFEIIGVPLINMPLLIRGQQ